MTAPPAAVDLWDVSLPVLEPLVDAHGTAITVRRSIIVRVTDGDGVSGWGEAAPYPGHTRDTADDAWELLATEAHRLLEGEEAVLIAGSTATAALDAATTDLVARRTGTPLAVHLGGDVEPVPAGVAIGATTGIADLVGAVAVAADAGYRHVKVKCDAAGLGRLRHLRGRFPDLGIAIDCNGTLSVADAERLRSIDDLSLDYIEQPFPPAMDEALPHLLEGVHTPVCLDESVGDISDLTRIAAARLASGVSLKPARLGPTLTLRALAVAHRLHLEVKIGGLVEMGIGRSLLVAMATHPDVTLPSDLAGSDRWFATDLVQPPHHIEDGHVTPSPVRHPVLDAIETAAHRHRRISTHSTPIAELDEA